MSPVGVTPAQDNLASSICLLLHDPVIVFKERSGFVLLDEVRELWQIPRRLFVLLRAGIGCSARAFGIAFAFLLGYKLSEGLSASVRVTGVDVLFPV